MSNPEHRVPRDEVVDNFEQPMLVEYPSLFVPDENGQPSNVVDFDQLQPLVDQKKVRKSEHPTFPYDIYSYSAIHSQRTGTPDDPLIDHCRGLIVDRNTGLIVARPFRRMTELPEHGDLPEGDKTVFEKLDGTMGVQYTGPNGELMMATRGSFTAKHAVAGTEMLQEYEGYPFDPELTYIWETISPEFEHPVDYGDRRGIVLLGTIVTATGVERPVPDDIDLPTVRKFEGEDFADAASMRALDWPNAEGFVVRMESGEQEGERIKVKFPAYRWLTKEFNGEMQHYVHTKISSGEKTATELMGWAAPSVRPMMRYYVDSLMDEVRNIGGAELSTLERRRRSPFLSDKERQRYGAAYNTMVRMILTQEVKRPPKPRSGNRGRHNMGKWKQS